MAELPTPIPLAQLAADGIAIRSYRNEDADALLAAVQESTATVGRWLSWCNRRYGKADSAAWIAYCLDSWRGTNAFEFAIVDAENDGYLGGIGINQRNLDHNFANLGYWIRESRQGQDITLRAARLAAQFAFDVVGVTRLEIVAAVDNHPSRRVAEKLGAEFEGLARNRLYVHATPVTAAIYSLLPPDAQGLKVIADSTGADLRNVLITGEPRTCATARTTRIARQAQLAKRGGKRVVAQQAAHQRRADAENQLQRLRRLQQADDARQHAEHACLGTIRRISGGRRFGEQAAIARRIVAA